MARKTVKMPRNYKGVVNAVKVYREMRAAGKIDKISALETLSQFVGKRGDVLKKKVQSASGRAAFGEAVAAVKKNVGRRPGKKTFVRYQTKERERVQKATETFVKKAAPDRRFKKKARQAATRYGQMIDVFASETYNKLREGAYGIGSDVVEQLLDEGLTPDDIEEYFKEVQQTISDYPTDARKFVDRDEFWSAVIELNSSLKTDGILKPQDVLTAYIGTDPDNREFFQTALENYATINDNRMSFTDVWNVMQSKLDPANYDTMREIIKGKKRRKK